MCAGPSWWPWRYTLGSKAAQLATGKAEFIQSEFSRVLQHTNWDDVVGDLPLRWFVEIKFLILDLVMHLSCAYSRRRAFGPPK